MIYLNDVDKTACATLREMMAVGMIQPGYVDDRSVIDIQPHELAAHKRVHLFAGIGGFEIAAQLAGWPDDRQLWTGGFPCQPFSLAGQRKGCGDDRYLWPEFFRLLRACRPEFVLIENVPGIDDQANMVLDRVCVDLESIGYEVWPAEIPACATDAAHLRNRIWIVANRHEPRSQEHVARQDGGKCTTVERSCRRSVGDTADKCGGEIRTEASREHERALGGSGVRALGDGQSIGWHSRRAEPKIRWRERPPTSAGAGALAWVQHPLDQRLRRVPIDLLDPALVLADGVFPRASVLHSLGNSIVPSIAKEILQAMIRATS